MKVKDLIRELQKADPEQEIIVSVDQVLCSLEDYAFVLTNGIEVKNIQRYYIYNDRYYSPWQRSILKDTLSEDFQDKFGVAPTDVELQGMMERLPFKEGLVIEVNP